MGKFWLVICYDFLCVVVWDVLFWCYDWFGENLWMENDDRFYCVLDCEVDVCFFWFVFLGIRIFDCDVWYIIFCSIFWNCIIVEYVNVKIIDDFVLI